MTECGRKKSGASVADSDSFHAHFRKISSSWFILYAFTVVFLFALAFS